MPGVASQCPGFYDDVRPLQKWERAQFRRLPFEERAYARFLGVRSLEGEKGYTTLERRWARPTFEINGITGGYQGPGTKTIVPAWAEAKITCRLVPDQNPEKMEKAGVLQYLRRICPTSVKLTVTSHGGYRAFHESTSGRGVRAAAVALKRTFGSEPVFVREGGSLPILDIFKRHLGGEIILVGLGLPDDELAFAQ